MLKKVVVISTLNPWNDIRIFKKEISSLSKKYNVTYICAGDKDENKKEKNIKINILKKPKGIIERLKHLLRISKIINNEEGEIYHIHNPELLLLVPNIKKKHPNSKVVYDMHEDFEEAIRDKQWIPLFLRGFISKIYRFYLDFLLRSKIDFTIVTTPLIEDRFPDVNNIKVIENFAPLISTEFTYDIIPTKIQNCINKNRDNIKVVFTGLINKQRGILEVIDAIKQINNTVFILIGIYPERFLNELTEKIEGENLSEKVFLFKSLDYEQMLAVMQLMDIGILPYLPVGNHLVTRPNKLFEYMMTSLPVISSDYPLYEEIIKQGIGISVNPQNIEEIKKAIELLSVSKETRIEMGKKGYELYKTKYNWSIEEKKLLNIYAELIGE